MKSKLSQTKQPLLSSLRFLVIILLVSGIFFRFVNLDRKVYWLDETHTSLRIFGYTEPEFIQDVFAGDVVNSEDLLKYQRRDPEKGWSDTIRVLAGNTEHTPLYYLMARLWAEWFGSSVAAIRSLSAFISLLAFPCIYWLCRELFESSLVGWVAIALIAISPFHVLYAQEARPYSLWIVATLLSSAALLRAMRVKTTLSWGVYAATVAFGLYSHWFFAFVAIAHAIYVAVTEKFRLRRTAISYVLSSLAGIIVFFPWIFLIITSPPTLRQQMSWVYKKMPLLDLVKAWFLSISRAFFDLNRGWCFPTGDSSCRYLLSYKDENLIYFLIIPIIILVGYSIYFLFRKTKKQVWVFVMALIGVMALALILPDLVKGGQRSTATRYLVPCLLGIQLAVAYCFATKIFSSSAKVRQQKLWQIALVALISLGVLSCAGITQAQGWWNKGEDYRIPLMVSTLNQANRPLLLYSVPSKVLWGKGGAVGRVMPMCHQLEPNVGLMFVVQPDLPEKIPNDFNDVFAYRPHEELRKWLEQEQNYKLEPVVLERNREEPRLWKLVKS